MSHTPGPWERDGRTIYKLNSLNALELAQVQITLSNALKGGCND